jgi:hypothetical protein
MDSWGGLELNRLLTVSALLTRGKAARWIFLFSCVFLLKIYRNFLDFHPCFMVRKQWCRLRMALEWVKFKIRGVYGRQRSHSEAYSAVSCWSAHSNVCFLRRNEAWKSCLWPDILLFLVPQGDHLCGLMVRGPGYRSRDPGSIPGATRFS